MANMKERLPELNEGLSDLKTEAASFFSGRWGRWRLVVIGLWSAVSLASLGFVALGGSSNDLGAEIRVVPTGFGTAVAVQNHGELPWQDVTITLSGGYLLRKGTVRPGERITEQVENFERVVGGQTEKAPRELQPLSVSVRAREGTYEIRPASAR